MIGGTLVFALLALLVLVTLLTHLLVEAVSGALLATWVALATDRHTGEGFQSTRLRRIHEVEVVSCEF